MAMIDVEPKISETFIGKRMWSILYKSICCQTAGRMRKREFWLICVPLNVERISAIATHKRNRWAVDGILAKEMRVHKIIVIVPLETQLNGTYIHIRFRFSPDFRTHLSIDRSALNY